MQSLGAGRRRSHWWSLSVLGGVRAALSQRTKLAWLQDTAGNVVVCFFVWVEIVRITVLCPLCCQVFRADPIPDVISSQLHWRSDKRNWGINKFSKQRIVLQTSCKQTVERLFVFSLLNVAVCCLVIVMFVAQLEDAKFIAFNYFMQQCIILNLCGLLNTL